MMTASELQGWLGPDLYGLDSLPSAIDVVHFAPFGVDRGSGVVCALWPGPNDFGLGRFGRLRALREQSLGQPLALTYAVRPFLKLVTFVPEGFVDVVRDALSAAGAGHIGRYSECSYSHAGQGTFRPLAGTHPFIGQEGELQRVTEYRLEMVVPRWRVEAAIAALKSSHPYEEVAYDVVRLYNTLQLPVGYVQGDQWVVPEVTNEILRWLVREKPSRVQVEKISWHGVRACHRAGIRIEVVQPGQCYLEGVRRLWAQKKMPWD